MTVTTVGTTYKPVLEVPGCQDIIVDYATTMAHVAMDQATGRGGKLQPEDFLYLVRKASLMHWVSSVLDQPGMRVRCGTTMA